MRMSLHGRILAVITLPFLAFFTLATALPANFSLTNIAPTVDRGTAIDQAADGRLFIAELGGDLKTYKNGTVTTLHHFPTSNARSEQGMFGLAEDPNFANNGWMYVHYFVYVNGGDQDYHVIMRFTLSTSLGGNPAFVDGSEYLTYRMPNLPGGASRHNGGQLVFGNDGYLYIAKGEGEHQEQAENYTNVFGKLIRIDPHSTSASNDNVNGHYGIPSGNAGLPKPEIFAPGFRNPWSMTKDPSSEALYIGDVGGTEEVNRIIPSQHSGKKFGWGAGGNSGAYNCGDAAYVCPMAYYNGGAITGVAVKRNIAGNWPAEYINTVFYSDHNGNWIKYTPIGQNGGTLFDSQGHQPLGLMFGKVDGNLYYCRYNGAGGLWQVKWEGVTQVQPVITSHPQSTTVNSGNTAVLSVAATGGNLAYQWQYAPTGGSSFAALADNAVFSGATTASLTIRATESQAGQYRAVVSNAAGSATTNIAQLTVNPPNLPPVITIQSPAAGALFSIPEQISFSATASDPEQGSLPASAFHWALELGHRTSSTAYHTHPVTTFDGVQSGSFASTVEAEPSPQVWLLLILTVNDNAGNVDKDTVLLYPRLVTFDAQSVPPGLKIVVMDQVTTNASFQAAIGNDGRINGNTPQYLNATRYDFDHWTFTGTQPSGLNGTSVFQTFTVPAGSAGFVANYRAAANPRYAFKAVNNQYVSLLADNRLQPNSATVAGNAQVIEVGDNGDGTLALKSVGNGMFCQAVGTADVTCDLASVGVAAAKWARVDNIDGTASFKNLGTNGYLVAEGGGANPLKANRGAIAGWEKFTLSIQGTPPPPPPQYAVILAIGGGTGTTAPTAGMATQVNQGGSLNVTATAGSGYHFDHWTATAGLTLGNAAAAATQVANVTTAGTVTAYFTADPTPPPPGPGSLYALKAVNSQYVTLLADKRLQPNSATVAGNGQIFEIGTNPDASLYIKASSSGLYCQALGAGDVTCDLVAANVAAAKWSRTDNTDGTASLKNLGTNGYLVAEGGGANPLKANRGAIGGWEKFTLSVQTPPGPQYAVTMAIEMGQGTLTPAEGSTTQVPEGANLSITAVPKPGYLFAHWHASAGLTLANSAQPSTQLINVRAGGTVEAHFSVDPSPPQAPRYAFKAVNNQYVTLMADGKLWPNSATVAGVNQVLDVGPNGDATYYLKSLGNGSYCQAIAAAADVTCDAAAVSSSAAKWTKVDNADGTTSFKNLGTNGYLVTENGGGVPLKANRANIAGWEKFTLTAQ